MPSYMPFFIWTEQMARVLKRGVVLPCKKYKAAFPAVAVRPLHLKITFNVFYTGSITFMGTTSRETIQEAVVAA